MLIGCTEAEASIVFALGGQIDCASQRGEPLFSINEWYDGSLHLYMHDEILGTHPEFRFIDGFHDVRHLKSDVPALRYFTSPERRDLTYRLFLVVPKIRFPFPVEFNGELLIHEMSGENPDAALNLICIE